MQINMTVNGNEVTNDIEPRVLLVHYVREVLGLTGTHWGCDTSNCGTCVVLMDGQPVNPVPSSRPWPLATTSERSRDWPREERSIPSNKVSWRNTGSNAASAPPA